MVTIETVDNDYNEYEGLSASVFDIDLLRSYYSPGNLQLGKIKTTAKLIADQYLRFCSLENRDVTSKWNEHTVKLTEVLCQWLHPFAGRWIWTPDEYQQTQSQWKLQQKYKACAIEIFRAVKQIMAYMYPEFDNIDTQYVLESIAIYMLPDDPWCTKQSSELALEIFESYSTILDVESNGKLILTDTLRPTFKSAKHRDVSAAGRKSTSREHELKTGFDIDADETWTTQKPESASLLHFVLANVEERFISENWSIIVPSVLVIIDEADPSFKARGCLILEVLISRCNRGMVLATGLAPVFWDACMSCLSYLPLSSSAVTTEQSLKLLDKAYTALFMLADIRSRDTKSRTVTFSSTAVQDQAVDQRKAERERARYLSTVLVDGIYNGLRLCSEQVMITNLLVAKLGAAATQMGVYFVPNLQEVMSILVNNLSEPFGYVYPPLLLTTLDTVDIVMRETAPRGLRYRFLLLKGLTRCWKQICEGESSLNSVREHLRSTAGKLRSLCDQLEDNDYDTAVEALIQMESVYKQLLR
ncbi:hypothetical protein V1512DRAFT_265102 [Lipomyces arxii]|uniref:uncharacterized protein n=1 Tax=Lipomyces arxii TaxID=56418 RepID=UPI0034CF37CB